MQHYSFENTILVVNNREISDYAGGDDVINITRNSDSATHKVGADGKMLVSLSADKSGKITFKLSQASESNAFLMGLLHLQEGGTETLVPISVLFQDTYRRDLASGTTGYLVRPPDVTRGAEGNVQEWQIVVERLDLVLGNPDRPKVVVGVAL